MIKELEENKEDTIYNINNITTINLENIKQTIEKLDKHNHIEIAKLLKKNNIKLSENNNGIFINLTNLSQSKIDILIDYIKHIKYQNNILNIIENKKEEIQNEFFKNNKDNV